MFVRKDLNGKFLFLRHCPNHDYASQTTSKFLKLFGSIRNQRSFSTLGDVPNDGICAAIAYCEMLRVLFTGSDLYILPLSKLLVFDNSSKKYISENERKKLLAIKRNIARKNYYSKKNNSKPRKSKN